MTSPRRSRLRRYLIGEFSLKRMIASVLFIYFCICLYAYFGSERSIFVPPPPSYSDSEAIIKLPIDENIEISAVHLPNEEADYTILYSHGNAEDLGMILPRLADLQSLGFGVFAYDYQGYGTSQGSPSEYNSYRDINAAYRYLTESLNISPSHIWVYGRSVGSGPSVDLASREAIAALTVESGFISAFRVVTRMRLFPFDKFDNLSKIPNVYSPVLFIHGTDDRLIPLWHGETLYEAANDPKKAFWVEGAGHNDLLQVVGDRYRQVLQEFEQLIRKEQR
ncbi:alpha/beta hydrolase [Geitlerinema sp. P-1104]|uniref:alpha/beta hydrolase n=1 Tax=Geitlerinema sp. P-1104 TaxID=2546230 RepID=UPI001476D45D|nr:alpha/beta hydrolase [Geitlerinema sp. P-1104]NMG58018.1 alpha/beta hydrolase [Geitlerinema sp. P-1104]